MDKLTSSSSSTGSSDLSFSSCIKSDSLKILFSHFPPDWEKSTDSKIQYLVQIPFWAEEKISLKNLVLRIQEEAFYPNSDKHYHKITVIVGINGEAQLGDLGLHEKVNEKIQELQEAKACLKIATMVLSFSWINPVGTSDTPRCDYHNFLNGNDETKKIIAKLKERNPSSEIYLVKLDADTISLKPNCGSGILSNYDEFIIGRREQGKPFPWLITGGYITSDTALEDQEVRKDLDIGVYLDYRFRFALGRYFPSVPYYTEANSLILYSAIEGISDDKLFSSESPEKGKNNEMENSKNKLLKQAREKDWYNFSALRDYFIFLGNPIQTKYNIKSLEKAKAFRGFEQAGQLYAYTPEELYKLKEVWQTHYNLYNSIHKLGSFICQELEIKYKKSYHFYFQEIFKAYDPLELLNSKASSFSTPRLLDLLFSEIRSRIRLPSNRKNAEKSLDDLKIQLLKAVNKHRFNFREKVIVYKRSDGLNTEDPLKAYDFVFNEMSYGSANNNVPYGEQKDVSFDELQDASFDKLHSIFDKQAVSSGKKIELDKYIEKINGLTNLVERAANLTSYFILDVLREELNMEGYHYVSRSIEKWAERKKMYDQSKKVELDDSLFIDHSKRPNDWISEKWAYDLTIIHIHTFCISHEPLQELLTNFSFQNETQKKMLLEQNAQDKSTALQIAFDLCHFRHLTILIEHGADIANLIKRKFDQKINYTSLLHLVALYGSFKSVQTVYEKLPNYLCSQEGIDSPIHLAISNPECSVETIQLLATKENVNLKGALGFIPLDLFLMNFANPLALEKFRSYENWISFVEEGMGILLEKGSNYEYSMSATYDSVLEIVSEKSDKDPIWHHVVQAYSHKIYF